MNITIIGAGALGSMLATKLSKNNNVTLVVKEENESLIKNQQIIFKKINGEYVKPKIKITTKIKKLVETNKPVIGIAVLESQSDQFQTIRNVLNQRYSVRPINFAEKIFQFRLF